MLDGIRSAITGRDPKWHKASRAHLKANPACVCCGQAATTVHHVVPVSRDKSLEMVPENWASVCGRCHFAVGHVCDWRDYNANFWQTAQLIRDGHQQERAIAKLGQFGPAPRGWRAFVVEILITLVILAAIAWEVLR